MAKGTDSEAGLLHVAHTSVVWTEAGQMLVCDYGNNRVQVCSDEGEWRVVGGVQKVEGHPRAATVSNNTVWVAGSYPYYLHKYVIS